MSGLFGIVSKGRCVEDLYYGTDYHSHLGTVKGGMAVWTKGKIQKDIHNLDASFRNKFEAFLPKTKGSMGIGVISDYDAQPLGFSSPLGQFALVTSGLINNLRGLQKEYDLFTLNSEGKINATELVTKILSSEIDLKRGITNLFAQIEGSMSLLILTQDGLIAMRDYYGRTPLVLGKREGAVAVASESCSFQNLGFRVEKFLGPGETILITPNLEVITLLPAQEKLQICPFLWVYFGHPGSSYEGKSVQIVRETCGKFLALRDEVVADYVTGIPDSAIPHALGYYLESQLPFRMSIVKYNETWGRSYTPKDPKQRRLVAKMKLFIIVELIKGYSIILCEDSIVRGNQLKQFIEVLWQAGIKEIHLRPAFPPILHRCPYIRSTRATFQLAARQAMAKLEEKDVQKFFDPYSSYYSYMVEEIRKIFKVTTLHYQLPADLVRAIGLPEENLCQYCWQGIKE